MKIIKYFLLALPFVTSALAESKFYAEAGVSYTTLRGASYTSGFEPSSALSSTIPGTPLPTSTLMLLSEDKSTWAPFVATGYAFSDQIGVRLSYYYVGNLTARATSSLVVGGDVMLGDVSLRFHDDVHVLSLAPEFKWSLISKLTMIFSPELNWVASRGEVLATAFNPAIGVLPRQVRNEEKFSFGASVGVRWSFTEQCDLIAGYKYTDLKPSWGRQAHMFSGGLHWHF